jgi:preprotein translocase subunit SecB
MRCFLQLNNYVIDGISVMPNPKYVESVAKRAGNVSATIRIAPHKEDEKKYKLSLEIQAKPVPRKEKEFYPYMVTVGGTAFFTFENPCPREEADKALRLNGASILYGLLRAQVAQITAQSTYGQFLLPTLNFVEMSKEEKGDSTLSKA